MYGLRAPGSTPDVMIERESVCDMVTRNEGAGRSLRHESTNTAIYELS